MSAIPDAAARARALDPAASFIVQAPAGSGKTELLIQRYLVLLARVERPEEIAAITFTRKAASEMRARVIEALHAAHGPRPASAHKAATHDLAREVLRRDAERGWNLEQDANRLRVLTIDALNMSLTRQMPVLSRFGAQPESVDDASVHYAEAARALLAGIDDANAAWAEDAQRLLEHVDNEMGAAERLVASLLARRDHWLRALGAAPGREVLEATLARVRLHVTRRLHALVPRLPGFTPPPVEDVDGWKAVAKSWLTGDGDWRRRPPAPAPCVATEGLLEALREVSELPDARYTDEQWEVLAAIARLLPHAAVHLQQVFERRGEADFVEIAQAASRALGTEGEPTDLLLALDYRIRHLLVDEFQDTSYTQKDLLGKLVSGWEPGDGRTLFLVGDPMQSIYRFREAEVGIFIEAQREGLGPVALEPLTLSANFRSQGGVVDWVNRVFARVMPPSDDPYMGAVSYSPSVAVHAPRAEAVTVHAFFDNDLAGEAARVAELVREGMQPAEGRDRTVAILVRSRAHLAAIVPRLRAQGLRFQAVEIETLGERPVVQDLLSLTRAIAHLGDRIAWLAVLRAPWAGLALRDLEVVAGNDDRGIVLERLDDPEVRAQLSADGQRRLAHVAAVMRRAWEARRRRSLRDAAEGAWLALGGPACITDATDFADAEAYLDHLEAAEEAGRLPSMPAFVQSLGRLFAAPDLAAPPTLQLMTIHRAKGLEFDTVIVPRLGTPSGENDRRLLVWRETPEGLLLAPMKPVGADDDAMFDFIKGLDGEGYDHEDARLLYVAATRARSRLHLLGDCALDDHGAPKPPVKGTLLAKLWTAVHESFAAPAAAPANAQPAAAEAPRHSQLVRVVEPVAVEPPAAVTWQSQCAPAADREAIEFSWAGRAAREVGSVVHRWLQRLAEDELGGWDAARVRAARGAIGNQLAARGLAQDEVPAAAERVVSALVTALGDERGRWLLGPHREAWNEHRVSVRFGGVVRHLVIDRTFRDRDGKRWIVDYKTSTHEGAGLEEFLDNELTRYDAQLGDYVRAFPGEPVASGLYFPVIGAWRERGAARLPTPAKKKSAAADAQLSLDL